MGNVFNLRRFNNVLHYDLKNIIQNFGPAILIQVFMPFILIFFYSILQMLMEGRGWIFPSLAARALIFFLVMAVFYISYGSTSFGYITDKKAGSSYIMLPASTAEKFWSMFLISSVIMPLVFLMLYLFNDWIAVLVGTAEGVSLATFFWHILVAEGEIDINLLPIIFFTLSVNLLFFLLGAIFFKKRKIVMTILCLFALQFIFFSVIVTLANAGMDIIFWKKWIGDFIISFNDDIGLLIDLIVCGFFLLEYIVLGLLIFLRIKTIKH